MRAKFIGLALVVVGVAAGLGAWAAWGGGPNSANAQDGCLGLAATIVAVEGETTVGTNGADVIVGTDDGDVIRAKKGNDTVCSRGGDDNVKGGKGNDTIDLGPGDDTASGGPGSDTIRGKSGDDKIRGNKGRDDLRGGSGNDIIAGGRNADLCRGNRGKDSLRSCSDRDRSIFYVATDGSDDAPGTKARPWATLQFGADQLEPGDTLYVRAGVYNQLLDVQVSGTRGALIKIRNYPGETPVIDGSGTDKPDGWAPLIRIHGQSYIRIRGFEIREQKTDRSEVIPIGILVDGSGTNIQLRKNIIHNIEANAEGERNAHGIAVYGTATDPLRNIVVDSNRVERLVLGSSEAIVMNGNVDGFAIRNNLVRNTDNIAIDVIGFEGTAPTIELDQARNGVVENNEVYAIDAATNPVYTDPAAVGIYIDGGTNVVVQNNLVSDSNIGIEVASENPNGSSSNVTVRNNIVFANHIAGLLVGGFDTQRGFVADCSVTNNTFFANDTRALRNGEVVLQSDVRNCEFLSNIIAASEQGVLVSNSFTDGSGNRFESNLYFTAGQPEWESQGETFTSLAAWRQQTGNDGSGQFADPRFVDRAEPDLALRPGSPALAAGIGADAAKVGRS